MGMLVSAAAVIDVSAAEVTGLPFEEIRAVPLAKQDYGYRSAPGDIVRLNDGRLLMVHGTEYTPNPRAPLLGRYSSDLGKTWGEPFVLVAPPNPPKEGSYYIQPGLTRLVNGDLILNYCYVTQIRPFYFGPTLYRRSIDDGKTWGDQLLMTPAGGCNLAHNDKLVQLKSGRLIVPTEHELDRSGGDHAGYVSRTFYSDDNGYSWLQSKNDVKMLPVEAQEPHAVELRDGRLLMFMRTYSGCVARSYSTNQGVTWSKGEMVQELKLSPNSSAINVQRIPSTGDLVLLRTTGGAGGRRTPFVSAISTDDGQSWTHERTIGGEPEDDYGYPSLTFVDDLALIFYHRRDGLYVGRMNVQWFYGK